MVFTYQYIKHNIEKLQEFLDFLFYEVWLVAEGSFDVEKLNGNKALKDIYIALGNIDYDPTNAKKNAKGKSAYFFNSSVENIYGEFSKIDDDDFKLELIDFYFNNNNIELLCSSKSLKPLDYTTLKSRYSDLEKALNSFYYKLYGKESPFILKAFGQLNKKLLPSHYSEFMALNDDGICPFCGINSIDGNIVSTKDAYDHFLPKSLYPFNSINFKNLAPMCYKCNSGNKTTFDPIENQKGRKHAFYPYSKHHPQIKFEFKLLTTKIKKIAPTDYQLTLSASTYIEEVETWLRIFKVKERYDELICNKHGALLWYQDIYDHYENASSIIEIIDADKYFEKVIRATTRNPKSVNDIIKREFLEECKSKGLFN